MPTLPPNKSNVDAQTALWVRARALFDVCLDLQPAARASAIETHCVDDAALRAAVQSLLRSHDALPHTADDRVALGIQRGLDQLWPEAKPGQRFGAFRIIEEVARGGMGIVYLAERADGTVTQRVALKVVGRASLGPDASLRLAHERRLLATLEHPSIARLIDAGEDETGTPYFAMEYVRGLPITTYCDRHALPLPARLRLFGQVCAAVQHAHANLVIHCDLKPGNILVSDDGLPKLLDFGIATTLDAGHARNGEAGSASVAGQFLSPYAAAPEQFLDQPRSVATDVYALGALLCEMTCGGRPFDGADGNSEAVSRRVLHEPPRMPSRLATPQAATLRGGLRLPALRTKLRGDIDAIVEKALRKAPEERYASVDNLQAGVLRHLNGRPIIVRGLERGYRLRKFLTRHALASMLVASLASLLGGFIATTLVKNRQLAQERDQAQAREREATFEQQRAQQISDFLVGLFQSTSPEKAGGRDVSARELLTRGRQQLDQRLSDQPELRATLLATISDTYLALDDLDNAEQLAQAAAQLRSQLVPASPVQQAGSLRQLANLANQRGHHAEALQLSERALTLLQPSSDDERASVLAARAGALEGLGQPKEAVAAWREALAIQTRSYGEDDARRLRTARKLAYALRSSGFVDEAERVLVDNLQRERRTLGAGDPALGDTLIDLAILARNKRELDHAQQLASEARELFERVYGNDSSRTAAAVNTLATIAQMHGDYAVAKDLFEQALSTKRSLYGNDSPQVASAEYNVGLLWLLRLHGPLQAESHLRTACEIGGRILPAGNINLANYRLGLGSALRDLHRHADAQTVLRQALQTFEAIHASRGVDIALARGELACTELARRRTDIATAQLDESLQVLERFAPAESQTQRLRDCRTGD